MSVTTNFLPFGTEALSHYQIIYLKMKGCIKVEIKEGEQRKQNSSGCHREWIYKN